VACHQDCVNVEITNNVEITLKERCDVVSTLSILIITLCWLYWVGIFKLFLDFRIVPTLWYILELFRHCGIFSFYYLQTCISSSVLLESLSEGTYLDRLLSVGFLLMVVTILNYTEHSHVLIL
jgi:hypothetical protein